MLVEYSLHLFDFLFDSHGFIYLILSFFFLFCIFLKPERFLFVLSVNSKLTFSNYKKNYTPFL